MTKLLGASERQIARLQTMHGPDDRFVSSPSAQLSAAVDTSGNSANDVFCMQACNFPPADPEEAAAVERMRKGHGSAKGSKRGAVSGT